MKTFLIIANIVVSLIIVILILIQGGGAGLGSAWGGGGEMFQTRRGLEKLTMRLAIIFLVIFFVISILNFFVK